MGQFHFMPEPTLVVVVVVVVVTAQATVAEAAISAPSKHGSAQPKHGRYLNGENTNGNTCTVAHIATIK
jgi:hypothetical protein